MLTGFDIPFSFSAVCLFTHAIQVILSDMAFKRSTGSGLSALLFKLATVTRTLWGDILIVLALFIVVASFEHLAGRTSKCVIVRVIDEVLLGKDTFFRAGAFLCFFQRCKMCLDVSIPAGQIVLDAPVFTVGYRRFNFCLGILFMSVN